MRQMLDILTEYQHHGLPAVGKNTTDHQEHSCTDLERRRPRKEVDFGRARPTKEVDFGRARPTKEVDFGRARSTKEVDFGRARPTKEADFGRGFATSVQEPWTGLGKGFYAEESSSDHQKVKEIGTRRRNQLGSSGRRTEDHEAACGRQTFNSFANRPTGIDVSAFRDERKGPYHREDVVDQLQQPAEHRIGDVPPTSANYMYGGNAVHDSGARGKDYGYVPPTLNPRIGEHQQTTQRTESESSAGQLELLGRALLESQLPRPEQSTFDGSPKDFQAFMRSFESNIASKVSDPALKLTYLIQHCSGDAKKLVKDCVLLPAGSGFSTAMGKLVNRFGQSHQIARAYIDDITGGPVVKPNDVNALVRLADDMANCQTVLSQLRFSSDLDSSGTLRNIVKRLPSTVQSKWVEKVSEILDKGREPNFADLSSFVEKRARVVSSLYGRDFATFNRAKPEKTIPTKRGPRQNVSTFQRF